jgi:CBS domain-containing protein
MKTLRDLISSKPVHFVKMGQTVFDVVSQMAKFNVGALPVLDNEDRLRGIFSERDLLMRCASKKIDMENTKIDDVMTRGVIVMEAHDTYEDCLNIMKQESIRHMPVRDGEKLVGVVSMRDLMQVDVEEKKQEIENLNSYIYYYK